MKHIIFYGFVALFLSSCIGNDIDQDFVEPEFREIDRSNNPIPERLAVSNTYSFSVDFFNDIGEKINSPITWMSSNPAVITIDNNGVAKGVGAGTAVISASVDNDNPKQKGEKITKEIARITVVEIEEGVLKINNVRNEALVTGNTYDYNVDFLGTTPIIWTSSNTSIATVNSETGVVTALAIGSTTITATTVEEGKTLTDTTVLEVGEEFIKSAILIGPSYGLEGSVVLTSTALEFSDDFKVGSAPAGYFYLSNSERSINTAVRVGEQVPARTGAWSISLENININDYKYIIFWCDRFPTYLGGGEFK